MSWSAAGATGPLAAPAGHHPHGMAAGGAFVEEHGMVAAGRELAVRGGTCVTPRQWDGPCPGAPSGATGPLAAPAGHHNGGLAAGAFVEEHAIGGLPVERGP